MGIRTRDHLKGIRRLERPRTAFESRTGFELMKITVLSSMAAHQILKKSEGVKRLKSTGQNQREFAIEVSLMERGTS